MKSLVLISIAILAGALLPIQGGINSQLHSFLKHPLQATFISFLGGVLLIGFLIVLIHPPLPDPEKIMEIPWYLYLGGIAGVILVTVVLMIAPKIGITSVLAGAVTGQLIMSLIVDKFGWFGIPIHPISFQRILGVVLLLSGMYLIQR